MNKNQETTAVNSNHAISSFSVTFFIQLFLISLEVRLFPEVSASDDVTRWTGGVAGTHLAPKVSCFQSQVDKTARTKEFANFLRSCKISYKNGLQDQKKKPVAEQQERTTTKFSECVHSCP